MLRLAMVLEDLSPKDFGETWRRGPPHAHFVGCNLFVAIAPLLDGKLMMQIYLHKAMLLCQVGTKFPYNVFVVAFCICK